ncbi:MULTISPECIES: hypothetical protein [Pseudomonas]|uniref:hypothetical protein n=1 Tax=Pseudomonas TaxID=286 RepID=UPI00124165AE|nr:MULTISPECIES: hypothetical protein [Pseudomonas]MBP5943677.1 hypothetical protein [Pseudomonas sp. P9(2020)]MBZ9563293.1 hypothetical protein [Pseudomonas sp. P116]VVO99303.1 hypothetical protein PS898_02730 [Pseudomonas fluorescens]
MSFLNQRGVFLQMMPPSQSEPNTIVSLQLARKELGWNAEEELSTEALVDSIYVIAVSSDGGKSFTIRTDKKDVDGDGDVDSDDKAKLEALAKAYVSIVNP